MDAIGKAALNLVLDVRDTTGSADRVDGLAVDLVRVKADVIVASYPAAVLAAGQTYTATVTTAATDLAANQLAGNQAALPAASNYVWTFTTAAAVPAANITVTTVKPIAAAVGVCPSATVNATFTMAPF